ncbi:cupin domain-containing protein [Cupriavidus pauculus]|uniref:cupin domain-containing protein n=1 Tax=Cupriavidus pauculus TaxID=82633 RepID=UPI001EE15DCE|nr:cupin domain-containing protein [Cupriavidus pauculus]GJG94314.1 cupin domain-containing protein [Cupriavidus pauculus]
MSPKETVPDAADPIASVKYEADFRKRLVETDEYRMTEFRVSPGQQSPWHFHTTTSDIFYVLAGHLNVLLADPNEVVHLGAGQSLQIPCGRVHKFEAGETEGASYLLIQGVGQPDFVVVDTESKRQA